ncbi:IS110 family transposase [Methylobacter sp. sgz302048]|uniref:IS110 family transposase n=1 Tax=Methylobacter sp. sgz302048 TaxID=3455945 RepID=UPI003FA13590
MSQVTVGVDIAKHKFDVARLENGKYKHKKFDNTPEGFAALIVWLTTFGGVKPSVCMEATGAYSIPLAECLAQSGYPVAVVNPARIKGFAKSELSRIKTDKADAKLIARYAQEKKPPLWTPPPANIRELQALLRRIEDLLECSKWRKTDWIRLTPRLPNPSEPSWHIWSRRLKPHANAFNVLSIKTLISGTGALCWKRFLASAKPPLPTSWSL